MATSPLSSIRGTLVGRARECVAIDHALVAVSSGGESSVLVVRGGPGIGKTALLAYAAERAGAFVVLRAVGMEAESDLPFAALHALLAPDRGQARRVARDAGIRARRCSGARAVARR